MALAMKEQFQIQIVPAYQAADGKRFHEAEEARSYTRDNMLNAVISAATKERPEFAKLDPTLLREFLLRAGKHVGAVMAEPLTPVDPNASTKPPGAAEGARETPDVTSRLRAAVAETNGNPMPRAVNPDIMRMGNSTLAAARNVDEEFQREFEAQTDAELRREFP